MRQVIINPYIKIVIKRHARLKDYFLSVISMKENRKFTSSILIDFLNLLFIKTVVDAEKLCFNPDYDLSLSFARTFFE
jgi:hypothetical protein